MRYVEKERKKFQFRISFILDPGKKIPKKIANKFKKLKNFFPALFFSQNGIKQADKVRKKFQSRIPFILDKGKKIPKKIAKKFKKLKTSFRYYFQPKRDEIGRESEKKFLSQILFILYLSKKIPKKNSKKIPKIKNLIPTLYLAKTGLDRPRKREKNFIPEFRSFLTQARKFRKKQQKNSQN